MLTLSTSNAEKALSDRTSSFVKGYYEADSQATKVMARIFEASINGSFPESVYGVDISYEEADGATIASYSCEVNDVQDLLVKLRLEASGNTILEWKTGYSREWQFNDSLNLLDPDMLGFFE